MNKDALIATVIGFGIGLIITGVFLFGPGILKSLPRLSLSTIAVPKQKSAPSPTPLPQTASFTIDAPLSESVETAGSVLVSGSSPTGSLVLVEGLNDELVLSPNGDGKYAGTVRLSEGKNEIFVTSYMGEKPTKLSVIVFYTTEKF